MIFDAQYSIPDSRTLLLLLLFYYYSSSHKNSHKTTTTTTTTRITNTTTTTTNYPATQGKGTLCEYTVFSVNAYAYIMLLILE